MLISGYIDLDEHTSIRRFRSGIPRLLNKRFDPDDLSEALQAAQLENLKGPAEDRKAYRTVVRVVSVRRLNNDPIAEVIVSAWNPKEAVALPADQILSDVPLGLDEIEGARFMANVNIYAKSHQDLFFANFEIAASPPADWLPNGGSN
ncbi:hypothetical protein AB0K34_23545 [Actinomadura sp. NPDC049382]|uniref:hypothetical protein n=1 Tax=Actinomadura sp. NPDC049382 TaxID=3158220 RepID=UPI0034430F58